MTSAGRVRRPAAASSILPNGLHVLAVRHATLPTVAIQLLIRSGSASNPPGRAGLADLTACLLPFGTTARSGEALAERVDALGASLLPSAGWDSTSLIAAGLAADTAELLAILSEMAGTPAFPDTEWQQLRARRLQNLRVRLDSPSAVASDLFAATLYPDHPYGVPPDGTPESVAATRRDEIAAFHAREFVAGNATVVVVGAVEPQAVLGFCASAFASWSPVPPHPPVSSPAASPDGMRVVILDQPELTQAQIRLGHPGIPRAVEDWFPLTVANYTLGGGGFSSRLMDRIRVRKGYTYGVSSAFAARRDGGPFTIGTFTPNETVPEVVGEALDVLRELLADGVTDAELAAAKSYHVASYPRAFETPGGIASALTDVELYGLGEDYIETWQDRMDAVTAGQVLESARRRFDPDNMVVAVVGRADEMAGRLGARLEERTGRVTLEVRAAQAARGG